MREKDALTYGCSSELLGVGSVPSWTSNSLIRPGWLACLPQPWGYRHTEKAFSCGQPGDEVQALMHAKHVPYH